MSMSIASAMVGQVGSGRASERFNLSFKVETRGGYPSRNAISEQRQKRVVPQANMRVTIDTTVDTVFTEPDCL